MTPRCIHHDCNRTAVRKAAPQGGIIHPMWCCEEHAQQAEQTEVTTDDLYDWMRKHRTWKTAQATYTYTGE